MEPSCVLEKKTQKAKIQEVVVVVCVFEEIFWNFRPMHGEVKQFDEKILQLGGKKHLG